jgi:hypothetical protein
MTNLSTGLFELLDEAFKLLFVDNLGLNHVEPIFVRVLEILRTNHHARAWFLECATKKIAYGGEVISAGTSKRPQDFIDADLICFVTHATKWHEFSDASKIRKQSTSYIEKLPGNRDIADAVDAALSGDWEDKDFYKTFNVLPD